MQKQPLNIHISKEECEIPVASRNSSNQEWKVLISTLRIIY